MKILVVHDRPTVREKIVNIIQSESNAYSIDSCESYAGARDKLSEARGSFYDLVVLDLTLPRDKYDESVPTVENAQSLLREVFSGGEFISPGDVIGISNDMPSISETEEMFNQHVVYLLEESDVSGWEDKLRWKLTYLSKVRNSRLLSVYEEYDIDVLIITALDKEAQPYEEIFELQDRDPRTGVRHFMFTDKEGHLRNGVLYSINRPGQAPAASETQALLIRYRPKFAFMSGFCGGIRERVKLCDVVSFEASYSWDSGKWTIHEGGEPEFSPRPQPIDASIEYFDFMFRDWLREAPLSSSELLVAAGKLCGKSIIEEPDFHRKHAGSGSAVVSEMEVAKSIRMLDEDIWAIDMESHGFYYACKNTRSPKPKFLCVKAISDFCDPEKNDKVHLTCSFLSAYVVQTLMKKLIDFK